MIWTLRIVGTNGKGVIFRYGVSVKTYWIDEVSQCQSINYCWFK